MDDYLSEKEQIEQLKNWWSDYGNWVIAGVVIAGLGLFGINYQQSQQRDAQLSASALYDELTNHVVDGDVEEAEAAIAALEADHADLAYMAQARLAMARLYMDKNRDQDAAETLRALMESDAGGQFRNVARLRLAKVLLYQGKAEEVVELLGDNDGTSAFAARFSEALGDAYYNLGDYAAARDAYSLALIEPSQSATVDQQFVQLKLLDLPVIAEEEAADEAMSEEDVVEPGAEPAAEEAASEAEAVDETGDTAEPEDEVTGEGGE